MRRKDIEKSKKNENSTERVLRARTKQKALAYYIGTHLYYENTTSPLRKAYQRGINCADEIQEMDGKLISHYCKNRWCPVCSRIRMGMLIEAYGPRLDECDDLWFITLTLPNVPAAELRRTMEIMQKAWRAIMQRYFFRNYIKSGGIGIKKLECTYNPATDTYHPHYHLAIEGRSMASAILGTWLLLVPDAMSCAQDIRQVDKEKGYIELFKYVTKLFAREKGTKRVFFDARHMDIIFNALYKKRAFERIGTRKAWKCEEVDEDNIEEMAVLSAEESQKGHIWKYEDLEEFCGYYDIETGEALVEARKEGKVWEDIRKQKKKEPPEGRETQHRELNDSAFENDAEGEFEREPFRKLLELREKQKKKEPPEGRETQHRELSNSIREKITS